MAHTTHSGRITGPVHYLGASGDEAVIPLGPCLVEQMDGRSVDIFWDESGEVLGYLEPAPGGRTRLVLFTNSARWSGTVTLRQIFSGGFTVETQELQSLMRRTGTGPIPI